MFLLESLFPMVGTGDSIADLYGTAFMWSWIYFPLYLTGISAFIIGWFFSPLGSYKTNILAIFTTTFLSIIISGYTTQFTDGHLSDIFLTHLIQMFMIIEATIVSFLLKIYYYKKIKKSKTVSDSGLFAHISSLHKFGFLTLLYLISFEILTLRIFILIPLLFLYRHWLIKFKNKNISVKNQNVERFYSILIIILLIFQFSLFPFGVKEIACKTPVINKKFNCPCWLLWEWEQHEREIIEDKKKKTILNQHKKRQRIEESRLKQEKEEKEKQQMKKVNLELIKKENNIQLEKERENKKMKEHNAIASELAAFSKLPAPIIGEKFESEFNKHLQYIRNFNVKRGKDNLVFRKPLKGEMIQVKGDFKEFIAPSILPDLYYYLLITHIPFPSVDSLRITSKRALIDDFYQRFENGIVFNYDYLPEQGESYYCFIPTDDIKWVRELMHHLLKDYNSGKLKATHKWITPDYYGSDEMGCNYRIIQTDFGVLITNYCGC